MLAAEWVGMSHHFSRDTEHLERSLIDFGNGLAAGVAHLANVLGELPTQDEMRETRKGPEVEFDEAERLLAEVAATLLPEQKGGS